MTITYVVAAMIIVVLIAEIVTGRHKGIYDKNDIFITVGNLFMTRTILSPLAALSVALMASFLLPSYQDSYTNVPMWAAIVGMLLIGDFIFYWVHRAAHTPTYFSLLYKLHATHHTAKFMNLSLMMRFNVFWPFVQPYNWVAGVAAYLGMVEASVVFFTSMLAWNALTHTNFRWDDAIRRYLPAGNSITSIIEWVFITPRLHHTHHGYGKNGKAFRNYCTMLSVYDRLFGTLFIPDGRPMHYGIMGCNNDNSPWWEQLFYPVLKTRKATTDTV